MKLLSVFFLVALAAYAQGQTLICYECDGDDCNQIETMTEVYCAPEITTTTEASTDSTMDSTTEAATGSPTDPTTDSTTEASTTGSVTDSTTESTTVSATDSTTDSSTVTTPGPTTDSTIVSTTESAPATTTDSPTIPTAAPTTESTTVPTTASTTVAITDSTTVLAPQSALSSAVKLLNSRVSRSLKPSASATLINNYRQISRKRRATDDIAACFSVEYIDNDTTKTRKGCVIVSTEETACEVVANTVENTTEDSCIVCMDNLCNSSSMLQLSVLTMFVVIFAKYLI